MELQLSAEVVCDSDWRPGDGMPHQGIIKNEVGEEDPQRKDGVHRVRAEVSFAFERLGDEGIKQSMSTPQTRLTTCLAAAFGSGHGKTAISHGVKRSGRAYQRYAAKQQQRIPLRRDDVVECERRLPAQSPSNMKSDGQAGHAMAQQAKIAAAR